MLIFGDAFGAIDFTIYFIHINMIKYDSITLIVFDKINYYSFAQEINKQFWNDRVTVIFIDGFKPLNGKRWKVFLNTLNEHRYLRKVFIQYFSHTKNTDIFFTVRKYRIDIFHFVAKLSAVAGNSIYLCDADETTVNIKSIPKNLSDLFIYVKYLILYDINLIFRREGSSSYVQISTKYIDKYHVNIIERASVKDLVVNLYDRYIDKYQFKQGSIKVIFFDQYFYNVAAKEIDEIITKTFTILYKYYSKNELGFKYHPTQKNRNVILEKYCEQIPAYIPGEFLLNKSNHYIISFSSNVLAMNRHCDSISLLDLVNLSEEENRYLKNYLASKKKSTILYVNTYSTLSDILKR